VTGDATSEERTRRRVFASFAVVPVKGVVLSRWH
jgi:hypothetical protein